MPLEVSAESLREAQQRLASQEFHIQRDNLLTYIAAARSKVAQLEARAAA